jgi:hypothetical protein
MTNKSIRFKVGMTVVINSDKTGCGRIDLVASYGYKKGDKVELVRYDSADETWLVKKKGKTTIWIKRKNLAPISKPSIWKIGDQFTVLSERETIVYTIKEDISYFTKVDICWKRSNGTTHSLSYSKSEVDRLFEGGNWKLVPPTPVESPAPPFKIGDKVQYVPNPKSQYSESDYYAQKDGLIPGNIYTVSKSFTTMSSETGEMIQWVEIKEGILNFNLAADCFATEPKKRMAVCVDTSNSITDYKLGETYEIINEDDTFFFFKNKSGGMFKWRFKEITDEHPTEATNNPFKVGDRVRLVKFDSAIYDKGHWMKQDELTIDEEYEVTRLGNNGIYAPNTFITLEGKMYEHPIDCFELVVPSPSKYTIEVVCNENDGYEDRLTIGKTYMAKLNSLNTAEEPEKDLYDIETNDCGTATTAAYCSRFTVVPKVGHTLTAEWLNNSTPKDFYGYSDISGVRNKWETRSKGLFSGDRKIERIEVMGGRLAALISDTCNIWIAVESIMRKSAPSPMPDIAGVEFKDREAFISELTALIAKHKK